MSMAVHTCQSIILIVIDLKIPGEHVLSCAESSLKVFLHKAPLSFLKYNIPLSLDPRNRDHVQFLQYIQQSAQLFLFSPFYNIRLIKFLKGDTQKWK